MISLNDIRSTFLAYFEEKEHTVVRSSPLVPENDPTLMFTNSGMVQFKNVLTGLETRDYVRAVTSQKCVRAGGKHNDLDNVGYTARHHTFFEMLGNFSFGDYFKDAAIAYSWDLITREFEIPKDRLWVTVYHSDEEAAEVWKSYAGLPDERIIRIATSDNFWSMGPVGPCGPCSEIFYDHGDHLPGGLPGTPDEDGDRYVEIWNLVFMQYEQFENGSREELPSKSIDTGMGLERIGALLQGKHDSYDSDLMRSLIEASAQQSGTGPDGACNVHHRVIADHLRSTSFLIADGVLPSNDGRGYVLRRIMRRAMRHAYLLGCREPLMYRLVPELQAQMGQAFPELAKAQALIETTLHNEEERFRKTLSRGLNLLENEVTGLETGGSLPGETAFRLYDTYGFPLDLTEDILRERGLSVDVAGFERNMDEQRARARASWEGSGDPAQDELWFQFREQYGPTEFLGYDRDFAEASLLALVTDQGRADEAQSGQSVELVFNQTPFYGEAGGQVGDTGNAYFDGAAIEIADVNRRAGLFVHSGRIVEGTVALNGTARLEIDRGRREKIRANHSATHLLHEALRSVLGDHVAQRGSRNSSDGLRFDFSHPRAMSGVEIHDVEVMVNDLIRQNSEVETVIMTPERAQEEGAIALFGEKYGDEVRVVSMGRTGAGRGRGPERTTASMELCGGTHVRRTGEIGPFLVVNETASSAGVRRVEALTGSVALSYLADVRRSLDQSARKLGTRPDEVVERIQSLIDEVKSSKAEVARLRREIALGAGRNGTTDEIRQVGGVPFFSGVVRDLSGKDLRSLVDEHKARMGSGAVLLISDLDGKAAIVAGVTPDLAGRVSAVDLAKAAVAALGGSGGGGRAEMAQAGARDASRAREAITAAEKVLEG
ncbi:MAG: alanine--tRNA ligase [Rhodobacteraceae bacterium]|nr:alanine--tRNA ligase [Paracoccaceae bacterium]